MQGLFDLVTANVIVNGVLLLVTSLSFVELTLELIGADSASFHMLTVSWSEAEFV